MFEDLCAPDIYFPIEIPAREYAGHVLLAVELAARGFHCTIGRKGETSRLMAHADRKGLMFYKHGRPVTWTEDYHSLVGHDPEAGVSWSDFSDFALGTGNISGRRIMYANPKHLAQFCFGPDDHEFLRKQYPAEAERILLSGSPRVSLWGSDGNRFYQRQVAQIASRHGKPVVFASSGGFEHERYLERHGREPDVAWSQSEGALGLLEAARHVGRETDIPVVIRPHPGESFDAWAQATAHDANITVSSSLDLSAWVRTSIALVHAGTSTSALESVCAGTPAISTETDPDREYYVSTRISYAASSFTRVLELVERAARTDLDVLPNSDAQQLLERKLLHPLDGAAQRVADMIVERVPFGGGSALRGLVRGRAGRLRRVLSLRPREHDPLGPGTETRFKGWLPNLTQVERDVTSAADILQLSKCPPVEAFGTDLYVISPPD